MNFWTYIKLPVVMAVLLLPAISNADFIDFPALDIQNNTGGATLTDTTFEIDATAFAIVYADGSSVAITEQAFSLTSTGSINSAISTGDIGLFSGSFTVGGGLLSGSFSDLTVAHFGGGTAGTFNGAVTFTGGSLMGGNLGSINGSFGAAGVDAKVGAVVPVPAAVWLFGSGLIGLIAVARRKTD